MQVILLERVENLGQMGDVVNVRPGYARNYLLAQKKALRANDDNKKVFEAQRAELEARNLERKKEAEDVAAKIEGTTYVLIRQSSDMGALYGSATTRDIADVASTGGFNIERSQVRLDKPLKALGVFPVRIALHPEVDAKININIARSEDEAERQERGENVLTSESDRVAAEDEEAKAEFFDEQAQAAIDAEEGEDLGETEA
ncbi:50S ribosomal protein L9 [Hyphococcus lacteus]|uniref:Large ribosomal subunit protein bL9 n=1 Tax=Hyphococcus lacteus TaxID=3143536 RepID=A0ABV3Z5S7_9PROT